MSIRNDATPSDSRRIVNAEQAEAWNGDQGRHWVAYRDRYDAMLDRFTHRLLSAAAVGAGERVLDVGCGNGQTTCAAGQAAEGVSALGVDLSAPMLEQARSRAEEEDLRNVRFDQGDAQVYPFPVAGFDVAISRFGVMFFNDPTAAFSNIMQALSPGGRLAFLCWQEPLRNEWIIQLGTALSAHVPLPRLDEAGSGPFSLADADHTRQLLEASGFTQVRVDPAEEPMRLGAAPDDVTGFVREIDLVHTLLAQADPATVAKALDAVRDALIPHQTPDGIFLKGAAWLITARRPS
ncbi:class I SAM-dependent methyltransferase [Nonomuraea basaltis]|uniref:class I SAM-dependent methyltransferase n=1 Tax=Nonomuraea basaltis TaxID=2495887 RepID=UPI00110C5E6A|nr:class I SAM-dependent methyltransferase [Nonomuraea basaltis]TMR95779.1 class I SAM-dependent methyltransferase [Nonomuraea basaltis]